ncbi:hypothetical protein KR044_011834, partial [Drosophila immigrans]
LYTLAVIAKINAQCSITAEYGQRNNYIFAKVIGTQLELLRTNSVPVGTVVRVVCSANSFSDHTCQNRQFAPQLPNTVCNVRREVNIEIDVENRACPRNMFIVGYRLDRQFLEIFRTCYDVPAQKAIFTIHQIDSDTQNPKRTGDWPTIDDVVHTCNSFKASEIYPRFQTILGNQQPYITGPGAPYKFNRGHLVPSADFGFCDQMRATYQYFNVVAQFSKVNTSNWSKVENWVRRMRDLYGKMTVCTGAIGVLKLLDSSGIPTDIYLANLFQNPVPKWTYKIIRIHSMNLHYAVITYNHAENPVTPTPLCNEIQCRNLGLDPNPAPNSGYTFCCDGDDFIN